MVRRTRAKGQDAVVARFGSERSFVLRTLYTWLTLTFLYLGVWPMLVIYAGAPGANPEDTPLDWYQLRLLAPLLTAAAAGWLWHVSPVPTTTAARERVVELARTGRVWPQVLLFLSGTIVVVTLFMLGESASGGVRLLLLTLVEAAVIGIVVSGYLHGALDMLLRPGQAALAASGLYALTFAMRAMLAVASQESGGDVLVALAAGLLAGALIGLAAAGLRAASGSIVPGILALWLLFLLLGFSGLYET